LPDIDTAISILRERYGKQGAQCPYERRANAQFSPRDRRAARAAGPCDGCRHADRCHEGLACRALELWVQTGRLSAYAPRQPDRRIYERLYG
jgi:hypothetical protein